MVFMYFGKRGNCFERFIISPPLSGGFELIDIKTIFNLLSIKGTNAHLHSIKYTAVCQKPFSSWQGYRP